MIDRRVVEYDDNVSELEQITLRHTGCTTHLLYEYLERVWFKYGLSMPLRVVSPIIAFVVLLN